MRGAFDVEWRAIVEREEFRRVLIVNIPSVVSSPALFVSIKSETNSKRVWHHVQHVPVGSWEIIFISIRIVLPYCTLAVLFYKQLKTTTSARQEGIDELASIKRKRRKIPTLLLWSRSFCLSCAALNGAASYWKIFWIQLWKVFFLKQFNAFGNSLPLIWFIMFRWFFQPMMHELWGNKSRFMLFY